VAAEDIALPLWMLGWLLLLPFLAAVAGLARDAGGRAAWVAPAIPAAGAVLVALHLVTVGIEHTANGLSKSSAAHEPLHEVGSALFSLGMLPFGVALIAAAVAGRALPRWLAGAALVVGLISVVNGTLIGTESAWGFLLSTVWVFAAGVTLAVRGATVATEGSGCWPPTDARPGRRLVSALPTSCRQATRSARQSVQRSRSSSGPAGRRLLSSRTSCSSSASLSSCRIERPVRRAISSR
jgi:hypothetical protein